jgi:colanic acid biosynthesis glycosyl transferase WcaI
MRIAIHDYAGHPFVFELSRQLAREGHEVRHFYFAGDLGPKGDSQVRPTDPPSFSIEPLRIRGEYSKDKLVARRRNDIEYGRVAGSRIAAFRPDVVLSGNTPLESQGALMRAVRRSGSAFVFWMQDFYSVAVAWQIGRKWYGLGRLISGYYRRMERRQIESSDAVVLISDGFRGELARMCPAAGPVHVIPNWGALPAIPERPKHNPWSEANALADRFVFLYSGTLGLKHEPLMLLELADAFADDDSVRIVVAAEGTGARLLDEQLVSRPRPNLVRLGLQPLDGFPNVLGSADVVLALLEADAGQFSVPSKVLSYLCAGRAILLSAPLQNLAAEVVREAGAGLTVEAGDARALVDAARTLRLDDAHRVELGSNGRRYAERHFDVPAVASRFEAVFEEAIARRESGR